MIDDNGYRPNVGIILCNRQGRVFWGRRCGHDGWQFPQGGIDANETVEQALFRELREEVGLGDRQVEILGRTRDWLHYELPADLRRRPVAHKCRGREGAPVAFRGQKQIWFLLRLLADEAEVRLDANDRPEFDAWRWIDYWSALEEIIEFKRGVYRMALTELEPALHAALAPPGEQALR